VELRAAEYGLDDVFGGDSRAAKFRLEPQQGERVLLSWHAAVPRIAEALEGTSPENLERVLRSTIFIGELTAKELFVHLFYARPHAADTTKHIPLGGGARCGARLVLRGEGQMSEARGAAAELADAAAVRRIAECRDWALAHVPGLLDACQEYQQLAPHREDPLRNQRVAREQLLDLADVEVMLCYYKNYRKLQQRFGGGPVPANVCPRGWARRFEAA